MIMDNKEWIDKHWFHGFLDAFGFNSIAEFIKTTFPIGHVKIITILSLIISGLEYCFGVPIELLIGVVFGLMGELVLGVVAAMFYTGEGFKTHKFNRFWVKVVVFLGSVGVVNLLRIGFNKLNISIGWVEAFVEYTMNTLFVFVWLMIALYVLMSIAENAAKMNIRWAVKLAKFLRINIQEVEDNIIKKKYVEE